MKIRADLLRVAHVPAMPDGTPVEPEQQPAERRLEGEVGVTGSNGAPLGAVGGAIVAPTTAGDLARSARGFCLGCKHFSSEDWKKVVAAYQFHPDAEKREELNTLRSALLTTGNVELQNRHLDPEGDMDVEHALSQMGLCRVLTEAHRDVTGVHPISCCPPELCSQERPMGAYEPRDKAVERSGSEMYDKILRLAQGKGE